MSSKFIPNSYQTPNALVDELMPLLKPEEWVVASYAIRHILGWQDRFITRCAKLSLSHFVDGVSGNPFVGGCGLSRGAVSSALDRLVEFGLLKRIGEPTPDGQEYELDFENVDMDKLCEAKAQRDIKAGQKMAGLRQRKQDKKQQAVYTIDQSMTQTDTSLCDRPIPVYAIDTIKDTIQNHTQNQSTAPALQDAETPTGSTPPDKPKSHLPLHPALEKMLGIESTAKPTPQNGRVAPKNPLFCEPLKTELATVVAKYSFNVTYKSLTKEAQTALFKRINKILKELLSLHMLTALSGGELTEAYR
jgi:hypothetical protein